MYLKANMNSEKVPALQAKGVVKDFQTGDTLTRILHGIDLEIAQGELVMLAGPSGCGKTTLISILSGILNPTSGEVWINGNNITHFNDDEKVLFRRKHLGFIFQQYNLLPSLTAAENAAITLVADDVPFPEAVEESEVILKMIGMEKALHKKPVHLSGGQQQRVAIARALVHQPQLLVCDEPTAALDAATGQKVMEILREIALQANRSVLVVTHDNRIFHFADRIVHMNDGRIESTEHKGME
jgi:putative ABC transport system ATP-binding protein